MECSICLESINKKPVTLECGHVFHLDCIIHLDKKCCPNCRAEIKIDEADLCQGNHNTLFYAGYYNKKGVCRICSKKSFKYFMLQRA